MILSAVSLHEAHLASADMALAARMAEELERAYPGYGWAVNCDSKTMLADIRALRLIGNWGFTLKMHEHFSWTDWAKRTVMGGGEILERFRVARRPCDDDNLYAAIAPRRDFAKRLHPDL